MRPIHGALIARVFEVTDAMPMSREALRIPLGRTADGEVAAGPDGRFVITVPENDAALGPFLEGLAARLFALGAEKAPPRPRTAPEGVGRG